MLANIRIDERLIHGQVATMWTNYLKTDRIIVVDNDVVKNEMDKDVLKMAKPSSVKLSILTARGAAKRINDGNYDDQRVFLIVKKPSTLAEMVECGAKLEEVNVGNMSAKQGSRQVAKSIGVTEADIAAFHYLADHGVKLVAQMVPNEDKTNFMTLLKEGN
ncbi:PTS system, mannose-specific IIB component [Pilibacter termitis]|uniref:PTS system, mannose-specific IIB component n=1 Tax=Pilibacter termitis TaxID=263852 RepID=A0A1T4LKP8_9ENTE|nr:PTS sugar transporter subunit IIB [Pilibacter termitis]SJZ55342.1 PTS system, mannose-specific IIB component [Pilibacter termitis]